jgi:nucleoside-diphosphate-sugar epimerase
MRILIAGCGDVGAALGVELAARGHEVWGLRRDPAGLPAAIRPLRADLTRPATLVGLPRGIDVVVYTAAPVESTDGAYRAIYVEGLQGLLEALRAQGEAPHRIVFTSSTAVYGQTDGSWVDETSPTEPWEFRGRRLLEAERVLEASGWPATVVRSGGIYGSGRTRLIERLRRGQAACAAGPPRYGNRIHRDDCVGALRHVVELARPARLYLAVDHEPAEECEVLRWLASRLGLPAPPRVPAGAARRRSNKRCRNDRLVASGYRFRYPTFREGYAVELRGLASRADRAPARHPPASGGSARERER